MEQLGTENHLCLSAPEGTQPHRSVFHDPLSQACSLRCFWHYIGVASHIYNKAPGARAAPPDHLPFALVRQGDGEQLQGLQEAEGGGGGGGCSGGAASKAASRAYCGGHYPLCTECGTAERKLPSPVHTNATAAAMMWEASQ